MVFNILYTRTVDTIKVCHLQVITADKESAVIEARKEVGTAPYFISVLEHDETLNAVHPEYY